MLGTLCPKAVIVFRMEKIITSFDVARWVDRKIKIAPKKKTDFTCSPMHRNTRWLRSVYDPENFAQFRQNLRVQLSLRAANEIRKKKLKLNHIEAPSVHFYLMSVWISWQIDYDIRCYPSGHLDQIWRRRWCQRRFNVVHVILQKCCGLIKIFHRKLNELQS